MTYPAKPASRSPLWRRSFRYLLFLFGIWLFSDVVCTIAAERWWFGAIGYPSAFRVQLLWRSFLGLATLVASALYLFGNFAIARRISENSSRNSSERVPERASPFAGREKSPEKFSEKPQALSFSWLLSLASALALLIVLFLDRAGHLAFTAWQYEGTTVSPASLPVPLQVTWGSLARDFCQMARLCHSPAFPWWESVVLAIVAIALLVAPGFLVRAIAGLLCLSFGFILSQHWDKLLLFANATEFQIADPLFQRDVSFYTFKLPLWEILEFWLLGLFLYGLLAVGLLYLLSEGSLSKGNFRGFSQGQQRHLHWLGGAFMLLVALRNWLDRFRLLNSDGNVTYGANFTDVNVRLPINTLLASVALAIGLILLLRAIFWPREPQGSRRGFIPFARVYPSSFGRLLYLIAGYLIFALAIKFLLPALVQRTLVQPNELKRERPYISRSIQFTRQAFDLKDEDVQTFVPEGELTYEDILQNSLTIDNIRLWDRRPLLQTNRQLQQIRSYYRFNDADIDRYTFQREPTEDDPRTTESQQVILAARELDATGLPIAAQTWLNEHLVYTHGYGLTMSPVNTVNPGGLPKYFIKDISGSTDLDEASTLGTSDERVRASIPIGKPRIYYGEVTDTYVFAPNQEREFDYPSEGGNAYNDYDGKGGVLLDAFWKKWAIARYLNDWRVILTPRLRPDTKVLWRRKILDRMRAIAPFLRYDSDPYLVVADTSYTPDGKTPSRSAGKEDHLYWIVDAYTTSATYPYADPGENPFNYIRRSVKVVVDAYDGSVRFYIADSQDPAIRTWQKILPDLFEPLANMPLALTAHVRYPLDYFRIQSECLLTYHMTDPQVFYNREDQWRTPLEIYGGETRSVEPYFLIMRLPDEEKEEFVLLRPFTPQSRNNLIAWMAGRSDGENYGKLLLYQFPKQELIYGPEQIEARINQDPAISQQISLWNTQGSRVIQGNLLVIPIEKSLLYVEPLYLEAEQNSLPTLASVIVVYGNKIAMAESLTRAIDVAFQNETDDGEAARPSILRSIDDFSGTERLAPPGSEASD